MKIVRNILELGAAGMFLWLLWLGWDLLTVTIFEFLNPSKPPIEVHSITQGVSSEGLINVLIDRTKYKDCPSTWDSWLISEDTAIQYTLEYRATGSVFGKTERIVIPFLFELPKNIPPGKYTFLAIGIYGGKCGNYMVRNSGKGFVVK